MLARTTNLYQLYRDIVAAVERQITFAALSAPSMNMEISEGLDPVWWLANAFPGEDMRALRWLARRRFGVFRPMCQRKQPHREGQSIGVMEPLFPGWLLIRTWPTDDNYQRARHSIGVMDILCHPGGRHPVEVPDDFVNALRAQAWCVEERLLHVARQANRQEVRHKQKSRPTKSQRKTLDRLKERAKARGVSWDSSTLAHLNELDPYHRIAFMERILMPVDPGCAASVR